MMNVVLNTHVKRPQKVPESLRCYSHAGKPSRGELRVSGGWGS